MREPSAAPRAGRYHDGVKAIRILQTIDAPVQPWRNGGGLTRELLAWAPGGGTDWRLRISVATISGDGPFSALPGVRRWITVLEGGGMRLDWPGRSIELRPADAPLAFDGGEPPHCTLLGGTTRDLNLMVRDGVGSMLAARPGTVQRLGPGQGGLYAPHGGALLDERGAAVELPPQALAWLDVIDEESSWRYESPGPAPCLAFWLAYRRG
jgi:environmental stress-induced protein Ves